MKIQSIAFVALLGYAAAECPNACSGHGTCGSKDACSCYQNYQGNDCSERTCYFGLAHVDSPKGDLNADGFVSGPLTTVVTGSEVYPWGTTEQFPNADSNEGHFYMECSNKGLCDRKTGQCDCFDGYSGTACARAACPNECSGHGTCESIKELAELRSFDTNAHDVPTTRVAGSSDNHNYNSAIEESYSYDLWDSDKTMGCRCDPTYYGADCSLKKCKYGVDPLFYDNTDGVIQQTTVVHLGSVTTLRDDELVCNNCATDLATDALTLSAQVKAYVATGDYIKVNNCVFKVNTFASDLTITADAGHGCTDFTGQTYSVHKVTKPSLANIAGGTFKMVFYDVFGERYVTKDIDATNSLTPKIVVKALEALPNGVIAKENTDVTGTAPEAVSVSMQDTASGVLAGEGTTAGVTGFGAGKSGSDTKVGAGLGTTGATANTGGPTGPEFTITFNTNPGILKSIELDTRNVQNTGSPDYWVANTRQGQFHSRYTTNLGRINTLDYGTTTLYTNADWRSSLASGAASASLVKVGGQEFRVAGEDPNFITLSEPFLGASITPVLTDTSVTLAAGTAFATTAITNQVTDMAGEVFTFAAVDVTSDLAAGDVLTGGLYKEGACTGTLVVASVAYDGSADSSVTVETGHGCTPFTGKTTSAAIGAYRPAYDTAMSTDCTNCLTTIATASGATTITLAGVDYTSIIPAGSALSLGGGSCTGHVVVASITFSTNSLVVLEEGHGCTDATGLTATVKHLNAATIKVAGVDTAIKANSVADGTHISIGGCSAVTRKYGAAGGVGTNIASGGTTLGVRAFSCIPSANYGAFNTNGATVYRRTDDPTNQNAYKAPSDTGTTIASNLMLTRGSPNAYLVSSTIVGTAKAYDVTVQGAEFFKLAAAPTASVVGDPMFVNGRGPMTTGATANTDEVTVTDAHKFFPVAIASDALVTFPVVTGITSAAGNDANLVAGSVLLIDGRRYKVKSRGAGSGMNGISKVVLSENYAGGSLQQVCSGCLAVTTAATAPVIATYASATEGAGTLITLGLYDRVLAGGKVHEDLLTTVGAAATAASSVTTSIGGAHGTAGHIYGSVDLGQTAASGAIALYKTTYGAVGAPTLTQVTEGAGAATYQYVAQCSNRGLCDASSGVCKCFKGYSNDNCDKQNMLAL